MAADIELCKSDEEVKAVVSKANAEIEAELAVVSEKTSETDSTVHQQIISTTEWAKGIVLQGSTQIEAIGVQIVHAGGASASGAKHSISALIESTQQQITTAYQNVDSSVTIQVEHTKVAPEHVHKVVKHSGKKHEHKHKPKTEDAPKKTEKKHEHDVSTGEIAAGVAVGAVVTVGVAGYVKSTVTSWFDRLTKSVAERAEQGGDNASADIEKIVAEATAEIDVEFSKVTSKTDESSDKESAEKLKATIEWAKSTVAQSSSQIQTVAVQAVAAGGATAVAIRDQLTTVAESATTQVDHALESCQTEVEIEVEKEKVCDED